MAIEVACGCGKRFRVPEEYEGRKVKCAACKSAVRVSEASVLTAPMPLTPAASPAQLQVGEPSVFLPLSKPSPLSKPAVRWQRLWLAGSILTGGFVLGLVVGRATHSDSPFAPGAMSILEFPSGRVPWFEWAGADADRIVEAQANLWPEPGPNDLK
jgi:hypothetical protein